MVGCQKVNENLCTLVKLHKVVPKANIQGHRDATNYPDLYEKGKYFKN